eukprot:SAG31_NODE_4028_length_3651_cov_36.316160_4_plen_64_part_01
MSDESRFVENVRQLHGQIMKILGTTAQMDEVASDEALISPLEAKEELERLRSTLQDAKTVSQFD